VRSRDALLRNLVDFAPDAVLVIDATGLIVYANPQAERLFGYENEQLLRLHVDALVPERHRNRHAAHRHDYAQDPRTREMGASSTELSARRSDGFEFPVEIRLSTLEVDGERLVATAVRDVTERRLAATKIRAARDEAERANALKGRFLATASHDLRQPLQTLQLLNGALLRQVSDSSSRELLGNQHDVLTNMAGLLNNLLDISKLDGDGNQPRLEDVSVAELFYDMRLEFESVANAQGLSLRVTNGPHLIHTDRILFRQVLENLLSNAIKYTKEGTVSLRCEMQGADLAIEVADTGVGIPQDQLASIFEEFYQVKRLSRRPGVGLGLAIVKRLVGVLGLSIRVSSEPGSGTRFRVIVPAKLIAATAPQEAKIETCSNAAGSGPNAVVLLVEDDEAVRRATALFLKAIGYVTITASGIADAKRVLRESKASPDIIVTDYHLGTDETGAELIDYVRKEMGKTLPALLLSGDTSAALHALSDTGSYRLLSKPVDADILARTIAQLLLPRA
jgi:two-component system, sensor histidine kinase